MTKKIAIDSLAGRVCQTIRDVRGDDKAKGWLEIGGARAHSVNQGAP